MRSSLTMSTRRAVPKVSATSAAARPLCCKVVARASINGSANGSHASSSSSASSSKLPPAALPHSEAQKEVLLALQSRGYSAEQAAQVVQVLTEGSALAPAAPTAPKKGHVMASTGVSMATQLVHGHTSVVDPYGASGAPLWQTATFAQPGATEFAQYDYSRTGNPTRTMLEEQMAVLEGADQSFAFNSGMAAIAVVCKLLQAGDHIVANEDIYGGTFRLHSEVLPRAGIHVTSVDMVDLEAVRRAIIPGKTKLVHIESPTNPRMQVCDIRAISRMAREAGALTCVDNSIMAPVFQRPLDMGADLCVTSGTKHIGGHGDVTLGTLSVKGKDLAERVHFLQNAEGAGLAPFDCWLALRGLKTMELRMERSAHNTARIAAFLESHPLVKKINYAGLPSHPGHELHMSQALSGGTVLSFETGDVEISKMIVNETKLFKVTVSFGNVNSLISLPTFMSFGAIPREVRLARGLTDDLVRISSGIEDADDLIADLDQAMTKAMKTFRVRVATPAAASAPAGLASNNVVPLGSINEAHAAGSGAAAKGSVSGRTKARGSGSRKSAERAVVAAATAATKKGACRRG